MRHYTKAIFATALCMAILATGRLQADDLCADDFTNKSSTEYSSLYRMDIDTPLPYRDYHNDRYFADQYPEGGDLYNTWVEKELRIRAESTSFSYEGTVTLPLIFHVLYSSDTASVIDAIDVQLSALNRDFGPPRIPERDVHDPEGAFARVAEDPGIRFTLGAPDVITSDLPGIGSLRLVDEPWRDRDEMKGADRGSPAMSPATMINIWVIKSDDRLGSYAQYPGGVETTDGIVIDERYFGEGSTTYDEGKALTHLIGSYLGLHDLWGLHPCLDDGVGDTPIHNAPNLGDPEHVRISTCYDYPAAMLMNFMDNTDDKNMYMFTKGQVQRMRYIISEEGLRPGLIKSN